MLKFWAALILGTIVIATGLTYLKLHRGAQTLNLPPVAQQTLHPQVEFLADKTPRNNARMEASANIVTFYLNESIVDQEQTIPFQVRNSGKADLELSLLTKSCSCAEVYVDDRRVTLNDHMSKIAPGKTATVKLVYKPKKENLPREPGDKARIRATFTHNDERYNDNLHFEIVTQVKPAKN